jgi:hypothetical protein
MDGPLAAMIRPGATAAYQAPRFLPSSENNQLLQLQQFVKSNVKSTKESDTLSAAMDHLCMLFSSRYSSDGQKCKTNFQNIGIWLWRCTEGLTDLLQERQPAALVIFAYACVAINDIGNAWVLKGWTSHLLAGIQKSLPQQYHFWMEWPIQEIGCLLPQ